MFMQDKDGFDTSLFQFLYQKDPILRAIPSIQIPDTIIFNNSSPVVWYFSLEGVVKQKSKSRLTSQAILEFFSNKPSRSGILAIWIYENEQGYTIYEYFDEIGLRAHFDGKKIIKSGVLQSFIEPKGNHNFTIRVIWGTKLCLFEKNVNKHKYDDKSVDILSRIFTFEIDKTQQETIQLVGSVLTQKLENQAYTIANHVQTLAHGQFTVKRMVLNYRIDSQDRLWLLGCTSIRVEESQNKQSSKNRMPVYNANSLIKLPENIDLRRIALKNASVLIDKVCQQCDQPKNHNDLFPIKIKDIIESWDFDHMGKTNTYDNYITKKKQQKNDPKRSMFAQLRKDGRRSTQGSPKRSRQNSVLMPPPGINPNPLMAGVPLDIDKNYHIPETIRKLYPKLKEKKYQEYLSNPTFLEIQLSVCQECFIMINKGVNVKEDISKLASQEKFLTIPFMGTGQLKPNTLRQRYMVYYLKYGKNTRSKLLPFEYDKQTNRGSLTTRSTSNFYYKLEESQLQLTMREHKVNKDLLQPIQLHKQPPSYLTHSKSRTLQGNFLEGSTNIPSYQMQSLVQSTKNSVDLRQTHVSPH